MSANQTEIPFPIFNADTIQEYPSIIFGFVFAAATFLFELVYLIYLGYNTQATQLSTTHFNVLATFLLCFIRQIALVLQYTTT